MKKIILYIGIAGVVFGAFKTFEFYKSEKKRMQSNYENLLKEKDEAVKKMDSLFNSSQAKFAEYTFKKDKELIDYLNASNNQLNGLRQMLDNNNIKIKQLTDVTSTAIKTRDTKQTTIDLDGLAHKVKTLAQFSIPIIDKTDCFEISGSFDYKNNNGSININSRKFTDTITTVDYWERKKHRWIFGLKTGLFGKKVIHRKESSKCLGNIKTIVIHKK